MNGLNIPHVLEPQQDSTLAGTVQKNVDAVRAVEGVPHINHPNFGWALTAEVLTQVENNRLLEPNVVRAFEGSVVAPLRRAAKEVFPASALAAGSFAESGSEDARAEAVALYDALIATIRRVLAQMEDSETLAAIVEELRIVIRTGREAKVLLEKLRDEEGAGIFGGEGRRDAEPKKPKDR